MYEDVWLKLIKPLFSPLLPNEKFFWIYIGSAIVIAAAICWRRLPADERNLDGLVKAVLPRAVFLHPSALLDYRLVVLNHLLITLVLGYVFVSTIVIAKLVAAGLTDLAPGLGGWGEAGLWASAVFTVVALIAYDFANFFAHWMQHKVPFLWEFHKVHHSAEVLTPVTASRVHPFGEVFSGTVIATIIGVVDGVFLFLYQGRIAEMTIYGVNGAFFLYYTIDAYHLKHSHVWVMFPRGCRAVFSSPALHLIHHSANPKHFDKNMGFIFTVWDRIAGTFYQPSDDERHTMSYGLGPEEQHEFRSLKGVYWTPVRNVLRDYCGVKLQDEPATSQGPASNGSDHAKAPAPGS
ncbi:MAG: sterol desaturase family protein [Pseudomonadota bacterium]